MNFSDARDDIFGMLSVAWNQAIWDSVDPPKILWQGVEETSAPNQGEPFARATVLHQAGNQASLAGAGGARKYNRRGLVVIQCFGPQGSGKGLTIAENLAKVVLNAFEGQASPGGIWFRNCHPVEVGPADGWFQVNVVAEFNYDEVK